MGGGSGLGIGSGGLGGGCGLGGISNVIPSAPFFTFPFENQKAGPEPTQPALVVLQMTNLQNWVGARFSVRPTYLPRILSGILRNAPRA